MNPAAEKPSKPTSTPETARLTTWLEAWFTAAEAARTPLVRAGTPARTARRLPAGVPERNWSVYEEPDEHNSTLRAGDRLLHVGLDREGRRRIQREISYMEQHASPYFPELLACAPSWLEVRVHAGTPPTGAGPWMRSLRQVLGSMHELEARPIWRPRRLEGLRHACPHRHARQAEHVIQTVWRHNPVVTTHGNLRPGYILTRSGFHLGAVTGFSQVAGAPPERDLASALLELTPIVGVEGVLSMFPTTFDRLALSAELLHRLDRLARVARATPPLLTALLDDILADPAGLGHVL